MPYPFFLVVSTNADSPEAEEAIAADVAAKLGPGYTVVPGEEEVPDAPAA